MAKLYTEAGRVVDDVLDNRVGLKAALYRTPLEADARAVMKIASGALGNQTSLRAALVQVGLLPKPEDAKTEDSASSSSSSIMATHPGVALVMAYDLLLGRGIKGGGHLKKELCARKSDLAAAFKALAPTAKSEDTRGPDPFATLPRYVRLNRLRAPDDAAVALVRKRLARELKRRAQACDASDRIDVAKVTIDKLVPNLLELHPRTKPFLQGLAAVDDGTLILQDRSSCLGALSANITPGSFVLDATAAPGSKTVHAFELLQGRGRLIAFERNPRRAASLVNRMRQLADVKPRKSRGLHHSSEPTDQTTPIDEPTTGQVLHYQGHGVRVDFRVGDFMMSNPAQPPFCDVDVLLVDPSCSGSGLPEHHIHDSEGNGPEKTSPERLHQLAAFQKKILSHALKFPNARTVVYSTCSTHREENEDVVAAVLHDLPNTSFVVTQALPWWKNAPDPLLESKKNPLPEWAHHCIRCDPTAHRCRGFFLCRLDRIPSDLDAAKVGKKGRRLRNQALQKKKKRRRKKTVVSPAVATAASVAKPCATNKKRKGAGLQIMTRAASK